MLAAKASTTITQFKPSYRIVTCAIILVVMAISGMLMFGGQVNQRMDTPLFVA